MEFLLSALYAVFFIFLIHKLRFFETELSRKGLSLFFCIKIAFGVALWYIYTYYYTDRATADIYKYFDDSKVMYDALRTHPSDYFRMLFAIGNDNAYFDQTYYSHMNYWYREFDNAIYNDSHTIIRFNALVRLFSFGYYNVHTVFMSFISFMGLVAIYKTFAQYFLDRILGFMIAVFLVPSVLLWSSGVLKEGFLFFGLGMLLFHFHEICFSRARIKNYVWLLVSLFILALAKFYVLACLLPGILAWILIRLTGKERVVLKFAGSTLVVFLLAINIQYIFPSQNVLQTLSRRQNDFVALAKGGTYLISQFNDTVYLSPSESEKRMVATEDRLLFLSEGTHVSNWSANRLVDSFVAGSGDTTRYRLFKKYEPAKSRITLAPLEPNVLSLLKNTPVAFFNVLVRPFIWESRSPMILFPSLENLFILLFCLFCFYFSSFTRENRIVFYFCILFVFMLYTLIGLITPVTGALVRYRVPAMPFLIMAFLAIVDKGKVMRKLPFLEKLLWS